MTWQEIVSRSKKLTATRFASKAMESASGPAKEFVDKIGNDLIGPGRLLMHALEAHVVADFPYILAHEIGKRLAPEFEGWTPDYESIVKFDPVNKLNENFSRVITGELADMPRKYEGEEVALDSFSDHRYQVKALTYGKGFTLTREAQINDDLGAFGNLASMMLKAAQRTLDKTVASTLHTPGNAFDGVAFYYATHGNAGTTALSADETGANALATACRAIRIQKDYGSRHYLGLKPKYLVVPIQLEGIAAILCNDALVPNASGNLVTNPAKAYGLTPVVFTSLSTYDTNNWYVFCSPADCESFVVSFLNGVVTPQVFAADTRRPIQGGEGLRFENSCYDIRFDMLYDFGVSVAKPWGSYKSTVTGGTP